MLDAPLSDSAYEPEAWSHCSVPEYRVRRKCRYQFRDGGRTGLGEGVTAWLQRLISGAFRNHAAMTSSRMRAGRRCENRRENSGHRSKRWAPGREPASGWQPKQLGLRVLRGIRSINWGHARKEVCARLRPSARSLTWAEAVYCQLLLISRISSLIALPCSIFCNRFFGNSTRPPYTSHTLLTNALQDRDVLLVEGIGKG